MPAAGVVTLILVLVTVAALAAALVRVALLLKHVNFTLGTVIAGVRAIELATRPINPVLGDIAGDLAATQGALDNLLAAKAAEAQRATGPRLDRSHGAQEPTPRPAAPRPQPRPRPGKRAAARIPAAAAQGLNGRRVLMPYEFACADAGCTCAAKWSRTEPRRPRGEGRRAPPSSKHNVKTISNTLANYVKSAVRET